MEIKWNILGWWRRRKAVKLANERGQLIRSRQIYRGQALRMQGRQDELDTITNAAITTSADIDQG